MRANERTDERVAQYSNLYSWLFWPTVFSCLSLFSFHLLSVYPQRVVSFPSLFASTLPGSAHEKVKSAKLEIRSFRSPEYLTSLTIFLHVHTTLIAFLTSPILHPFPPPGQHLSSLATPLPPLSFSLKQPLFNLCPFFPS